MDTIAAWTGHPEYTSSVALGDIDGDGDLDLVCGNRHPGPGAALYLNTGNSFAPDPAWTGPQANTFSVALADVDVDGDLDLVCGNHGPSTLYRNVAGRFEDVPVWTGLADSTESIALADVTGDNQLDLICGNLGRAATLYVNLGGVFAPNPISVGQAEFTRSIAVGDIDGDGDFDLVRGNYLVTGPGTQPSTLYLNEGGSFGPNPIAMLAAERTLGIALGDVDGNGTLDLVRANDGSTSLYLNTAGTFSRHWVGPGGWGSSAVLGDIDGDGDLDLFVGNAGPAASMQFQNMVGCFEQTPAWTGPPESTQEVALGDVDGDHDLDLIRGNNIGERTAQAASVYLSEAGRFASGPTYSLPAEITQDVALGDVDGDGDLDLIRAGFETTLYRNAGGAFENAPAWSKLGVYSPETLGDIDNDGDLDLVGAGTVYLNRGGTFADTSAWTLGRTGPQGSFVALGDVNGDSYLDAVTGGQPKLYLNRGGTIDTVATWTGPPDATQDAALGDVDGDGAIDLVCGNYASATFYRNTGGIFASQPAWTGSAVEYSTKVALSDVDGDGDLDLVRGNQSGPATVYLNSDGMFGQTPAWSGLTEFTEAIAVGDINGDGRADLVRGNSGDNIASVADLLPATLYLGRHPWVSGQGPVQHLPNNAAHLRSAWLAPSSRNQYAISLQAFDAESDPLWVLGEYQYEGERIWYPMELGDGSITDQLASSPTGVGHRFNWDISTLPFDDRKVSIRLHAISNPRRGGTIQFIPRFVMSVGRLVPDRPGIGASPGSLAFNTMTVGDRATEELLISNVGTRDLVLDRFESPDTSVVVMVEPGVMIAPGTSRTVTVRFSPRLPLAALGPLRIRTNDPTKPTLEIPMSVDVRAIEVESHLVAVAPKIPLGEAATVVVTPAAQVHVEGDYLHFRERGSHVFADSVALVPQGSNFAALVPGRSVTEAGLEYFIRVQNNGVVAVDPLGAPDDSVFFQPVASPAGISGFAQESDGGGFPTRRATPVHVSMPVGAIFDSGAVHYRPAGAAAYDSVSLYWVEVAPGVFVTSATIPDTAVGPRGVEYWTSVTTLTRRLRDPSVDPATHPRAIRTTVASLAENASHAGKHYRMVSVPLELLNLPKESSLEDLLAGQPEFGPYDPTNWRSFRWQPTGVTSGDYLEVSAANTATGKLRPEPGRAFWLIARETNRIDTAPIAGRSTVPTPITLAPGWNQVGSPYAYRVAWSSVSATGPSGPVTLQPPVAWNEAAGRYDTTDVEVLEPFVGYWIYNQTGEPVTLDISPVEAVTVPTATRAMAPPDTSGWRVQITAVCGGASDSRNFAGVAAAAQEGDDALDRAEPPMAPGEALSLYFAASETGGLRSFDLRPPLQSAAADPAEQGRRWAFDLARSGGQAQPEEASLTFTGLEHVPATVELRLMDRTLGRVVDLRREGTYTYVAGARGYVASEREARFEFLAGTGAFLEAAKNGLAGRPARTQLLPTSPNPVVSTSAVRYELARSGRVRLELYDFAGRRVRTLADGQREAGRYELAWQGDDDAGRRLPPGVYLLRLASPDRSDVRKVVVVR